MTHDISPAFGDTSDEFAQILPPQATSLNVAPARIELGGRKFLLDNKDEGAQYIYKAIVAALQSDWYHSLTKKTHLSLRVQLSPFLPWLSQLVITLENRFTLLKQYEAYRVNEMGLKPQSTGVSSIILILKYGKNTDAIDRDGLIYLDLLLDSTVLSVPDEKEPYTLTGFFTAMPWLRSILGERKYLMLESPKRLIDSFSITIAATLEYIIETKQHAITRDSDLTQLGLLGKNAKKKPYRLMYYSRDLLIQLGQITNDGHPADDLTELLLQDTVDARYRKELLARWNQKKNIRSIPLTSMKLGRKQCYFRQPHIFARDVLTSPSPLEQHLFAWLCAWQTIQPSDVCKLKNVDFVISRNHASLPVSIQCSYYKGRSGNYQEPPLLDAKRIEGRALLAYLRYFPPKTHKLFNINPNQKSHLNIGSHDPLCARLIRLWQSPIVRQHIEQQLKKRQCNALFVHAFIKMAENSDEMYDKWRARQNRQGQISSVSVYRRNTHRFMPFLLFGLSAIKTSAVYARTDEYRDGDLVNHNSHTAATEKSDYITDANKEWLNQNGRLTRMVLHDIENYVYRPNLNAALKVTHDRLLRTRVVNVTASRVANPDSIRIGKLDTMDSDQAHLVNDAEQGDILVWDTPETVVNMLHYMAEAERQYQLLINHALPFFERSVLPMVEWMHCVIQQHISPYVVRQGTLDYEAVRDVLPPHFSSQLYGGVSA